MHCLEADGEAVQGLAAAFISLWGFMGNCWVVTPPRLVPREVDLGFQIKQRKI